MPKLRAGTVIPNAQEDERINAGIVADSDNPELDVAWFKDATPASAVLPREAYQSLLKRHPGQRGPQKRPTKERITIRLSHDVLETFRQAGDGWQTRIDEALREYVARQR